MCKVCDTALKLPPTEAIELITKSLDAGGSLAHFDEVLDKVLDTVLNDEDPELAEAWERGYRGQ